MLLQADLAKDSKKLEEIGVTGPDFDLDVVKKETLAEPTWLHCGAGNIFRAFLGSAQQTLLNKKLSDKGIIAAEGYDFEIVDVMREYDNLTLNVTLKESGQVDYDIIGSIVEYLKMDLESEDFVTVKNIFKAPSLQMVSFTITEKGYSITDPDGNFTQAVLADFENGPAQVQSYIGKIVYLMHERYQAGKHPVALVSMDNMSHNGDVLAKAVLQFAEKWIEKGFMEEDFLAYLKDESLVAFPWSMIDKITPRPDSEVKERLEKIGFENIEPRTTERHTYVAPYVNGEETEYLIVEDKFPNGRPQLEEAGIIFTDRDTVNATEIMKVTACLNPLHTALAIFGSILGHTSIHEEMKDEDLVKLIEQLGYQEGLPKVVDPKIISPKKFIDEVLEQRLPNPFIPDTPQRIATDTSQKMAIRFGNTLKAYVEEDNDVSSLVAIPLVYAGWLRYLMAIDEDGNEMTLSPDPLLPMLRPIFEGTGLGEEPNWESIKGLLRNEDIFGIDLFEAGIAETVLEYFAKMIEKPGAVRETIKEALKNI